MKALIAMLALAAALSGCGSGTEEAAKPTAAAAKEYRPETGKLSDLQPGGGPPRKGAGTGSRE